MENKGISMARPTSLYINAVLAAIVAIAIVYVNFLDDYLHSLLFVINYILLFALIIMVSSAFKKGQKEVVKAGTAAILTVEFTFHTTALHDMMILNYYYFFSGNTLLTCIGCVAVVLFIIYLFVFINHFRINETNSANTDLVLFNKKLLIIIAILSAVEAILVTYNDNITGRNIELHLVLTYVMHVFVSLIIVNVEVLINVFRDARDKGMLAAVVTNRVGAKAARVAGATKVIKVKNKKKVKAFKEAVNNTKK